MVQRYLHPFVEKDLKKKMVFIAGPRQVGKTTLTKQIGGAAYSSFDYLNWDEAVEHRKRILKHTFKGNSKLLIFDEIHKYRKWKTFLKGLYDVHHNEYNILVSGSARLNIYRRGGDSLMGRYHYYRLHPFTFSELLHRTPRITPEKPLSFSEPPVKASLVLDTLMTFGGFPEPLLSANRRTLRRFQKNHTEKLVREDIRDIEPLRDISTLEIVANLLTEKVGSLFSINALREDVEVTHRTLAHWIDILEQFYIHYRIRPFAAKTIRSLKKEPKLYLWDWSVIENESAKWENMIASHLLKTTHFLQDAYGYDAQLYFLRDREGREVDFLVCIKNTPWFAVEVKQSSTSISKNLLYFKEKLSIPYAYQITREKNIDVKKQNVRIMSAESFLTALY